MTPARCGHRRRPSRQASRADSVVAAWRRARRGRRHQPRARRRDRRRASARAPLYDCARDRRSGRRRHHRGADRDASRASRCRFSRRGVPVAGREADRAVARRGRRDDRRGRQTPASCSPSATPSGSIRRWPPRGRSLTDPRFIEVHRLGRVSGAQPRHRRRLRPDDSRSRRRAVAGRVRRRVARGGRRAGDHRTASTSPTSRLRFANGCIANLTASRISRDQRAEDPLLSAGRLRVDRLRGAEGRAVAAGEAATTALSAPSIEGGEMAVANEEPLARELADFVDAVASTPRADGDRRSRPPRARARAADYR